MATSSNELPQQGSNSSFSAAAVKVSEDVLMKQNTDCVYFLASPLTCKKGSECEFRHSESARTNPRDCWYWLNGNCLNPKCAFQHPPLDVLAPPQAGNFIGPSPLIPPSGPPVPPKQAVPCIFFQQGFCLKADRCPFLHGPASQSNTTIRQTPATTAAAIGVPTFKKTFGAPEKGPQNNTGFLLATHKVVEAPRRPHVNTAPKVIEGRPGYKETTCSVEDGSLRSRAARMDHPSSADDKNLHNRRDIDDTLRESSPGFDVLVDDKLSKDEYYPDEDKYLSIRSREGRRLNEFSHHDHLDSVAYVDLDNYHSKHDYNSFNGLQDDYARSHRGAASERQTSHERRGLYKSKSPDFTRNSSDLRHRLSQQRRGNGVRSVVSPDYKPDYIPKDRGYRSSQRDARSRVHDRSVGSRLQGKIKLPRRSPPVGGGERQVSSHQSRLGDRLSGRIWDESNEGRNYRGQIRKDSVIQGDGREFSGMKRLSELQGASRTDSKQQQSTVQQSESGKKFRDTVLGGSLGTEGDISFDGPKPLSEILKRKRKAGMTTPRNIVNIENEELNKQIESTSNSSTGTEKQVVLSSASAQTRADVQQQNNKGVTVDGDEEGEISNKKVKLIEGESSVPDEEKDAEEQVKLIEDESSVPEEEKHAEEDEGQLGADGEEHEVDEEYDQGDEEYDYEQDADVEGYNLDEGEVYEENAGDMEEDFMDEDDGDDFAKKLGVSF